MRMGSTLLVTVPKPNELQSVNIPIDWQDWFDDSSYLIPSK